MSPNKILPNFPYTLSYFITDPFDSNTYYVQAVVYDALTGEVLDTQSLTRQTTNTRLFSKRAQAPGDPSGQGRKIIVVATAYTDSGFTTKSENYQEQSEVYLVQKELTYGGGGSFGPDYGKIREIMQEEIKKSEERDAAMEDELVKKMKPEKVKFPEMPFDAVFGAIGAIQREINRIPKESVDLTPLKEGMMMLMEAIEAKEVTPETDFSPVISRLEELLVSITGIKSTMRQELAQEIELFKQSLPALVQDAAAKAVASAKLTLALPTSVDATATIERPEPKVEAQPQQSPFDITKLIGKMS